MQTRFQAGGAPAALDPTSYLRPKPDAAPRQNRKLPNRILVAAHEACDLGDLDVAAQLLLTVESVIMQRRLKADPQHQRTMESMIAAYHRLWLLRLNDRASSKPVGQTPSFHGDYISGTSAR